LVEEKSSTYEQYARLLHERQRQRSRLQRRSHALAWAKIAAAVAELGVGLWFLYTKQGAGFLLLPLVAFLALAVGHERVLRALRTLRAAVLFYERGLARLEDRWSGTGETGLRFLASEHPYARDLDLFGKGSLFELLSTVRTRAGEETLAGWLLNPAPVAEIRARQQAVEELRARLVFREELFTAGDVVAPGLHPEALTAWASQPARFGSVAQTAWAILLGLVWLFFLVDGLAHGVYWPLFLVTVVNFALNLARAAETERAADAAEDAAKDLNLLVRVLRLFEAQSFASPKLAGLQQKLRTEGLRPSEAIARLDRISFHLAARRNVFARLLSGVLFYSFHMTTLVEHWRVAHGGALRAWLEAVGEFEALAALAGYAYEHPADVWPELVEDQGPLFLAESLAHPLLPAARAVSNDLAFGRGMQLMMLSGPNMAGKSTFMRSIGANAVLAQCGAPVRARRLQMSPLSIGASICVLDSLEGGISRFYAEIKRLKLIVDLTEAATPVLFLLDELLSGTNSFDRRKGTASIVRTLVGRGAIGLVTTHDLALTEIPKTLGSVAENCHFEDRYEAGKLIFDYKLKPGVVDTSNALKLMQSIGLPGE
jgi:hypothetical protein